MLTLQIFAFILSFSALAAFSKPTTESKRSTDDLSIMDVVTTLHSQTSLIIPEINSLVASGVATKESISPLISRVVDNLNQAHSSLVAITTPASTDTAAGVGQVMGAVVSDITTTFTNAQTVIPDLDVVLQQFAVDDATNQILVFLDDLLNDVLNFVTQVLIHLVNSLIDLGFKEILQSLGL
ncbi:hypothetical protein JR316_0006616 [Psilocybe cubensis]|uniref:Sc15 protein n=2 Tax=Psilocybe cubensis TaxID=181762 RepID=A0A8H7XKR4_PSICU|nr:hypothetical protein JR316_0006616 [Psilocybe cubensis]KAH9480019.1 hypothetical protein JR316_0006616 [Psilocybe cubensis]